MSKIAPHVAVAGIDLRRDEKEPLAGQLYRGFRAAILSGQLRPGTRLPSTRTLSEDFGVARTTVVAAYEQLLIEGYLEARVGSGTYVARSLPDEMLSACAQPAVPLGRRFRSRLSRRGDVLASSPVRLLTVQGAPRPFASGLPDPEAFPLKTWTRLIVNRWRRQHQELLAYGDPAGYLPLRQAIAAHVRTARAVRCETEQVVIVSGSQQGLDLVARLLIDPGDAALIEDPGYPGARSAFGAAGATLFPLPVDAEGADIRRVRSRARVRLAFVTPSHQYPLGVTMSLARRLALLRWAQARDAWIVEDDYDSDFRYQGKPLPALQGVDDGGRVIYVGSFSKTLYPSLRLGFLVLPPELVEPFRRARSVVDGHSPVLEQAALAEFISEGHFARHIRRTRALYGERQQILVEAARQHLDGLLEVRPTAGGMHLVGWLPPGRSDVEAADFARHHGVHVSPLSSCAFNRIDRGGLLLGYAAFRPDAIRGAVSRLGQALEHFA